MIKSYFYGYDGAIKDDSDDLMQVKLRFYVDILNFITSGNGIKAG
jgi:hypothetical protein